MRKTDFLSLINSIRYVPVIHKYNYRKERMNGHNLYEFIRTVMQLLAG